MAARFLALSRAVLTTAFSCSELEALSGTKHHTQGIHMVITLAITTEAMKGLQICSKQLSPWEPTCSSSRAAVSSPSFMARNAPFCKFVTASARRLPFEAKDSALAVAALRSSSSSCNCDLKLSAAS